jgi:hypothetical protein
VVQTPFGSGACGYADGTGINASLCSPNSVSMRTDANSDHLVYVAESFSIRLITVNNSIPYLSTYAGTSTSGFVEGFRTQARFNNIAGLVHDSVGNMYVRDRSNRRIRKISNDGASEFGFEPMQLTTTVEIGASVRYGCHSGGVRIRQQS